jgi:transcriptional regulator with GAF, ATPase, and Fis domain
MAEAKSVPDRYRRLELLGEGGASQVWLVQDRLRPGSRFALKEAVAVEHGETLRREFVLLSRLRHPGLVEAYDLDRSPVDATPRFALEYVDGESLLETSSPERLQELVAEALRVLGFLHDFGLIHRALKPENLLVRRRPRLGCRLVLLDLGLAASLEEESPRTAPAGTLPYMAPELFDGAPPGRRSDLYSLGALLYEVVHGRPPFLPDGPDLAPFIERIREGRRKRPPLPDGHPPGLAEWLEELLSPDPARRPAGAAEALARLNGTCGTTFPWDTPTSRAARLASDPPPGREKDLRRLWDLLDPSLGPRVVWLTGAAGCGKSRALRWLRAEAILRDWFVVSPSGGGAEIDVEAAGPDDLLRLLREAASCQPALMLVDEVDSAGGNLIRCLDRIAREGRGPAVQVVAALRPGGVSHELLRRLIEHTGTVPTLRRFALQPLDAAGIRALAQRATGGKDLSEARLRWLAGAADGSPLLAEALLVDGAWEKGGREKRSRIIERSVRARLGLLSETALGWLECLAVVGADLREETVAELSGLDAERSRDAAEELLAAGLAEVREGRWSAASRAVAEQALERMASDRRSALHRRAAELLEGAPEGAEASVWQRARLWSAAGESERAKALAERAAVRSTEAGDPAEAADRYAFALHHCPPSAADRLSLRRRQAAALTDSGRHRAAARAWGGALRLAREPRDRADLLVRQAHALVHAGRFGRAQAVVHEALVLAEQLDLPLVRAGAQKALGMVLGRLGRESEALPLFDRALETLREHGETETEAETLQNRAACKSRLQREDAEADFHRAIELYRALEQRGGELKSLVGVAVIHQRGGRFDRARQLLEEVRERAVEQGNLDLQEAALSKLALLATEQGRIDSAIAQSHEALDHACHLGDQNRMMVDRCRLAESLIVGGRPAEAVDLLRKGMKAELEQVEPDVIDFARILLAQALLESSPTESPDVRLLIERSQEGFRRRRKSRPLLIALVLELERLAAHGTNEPFEPVRMEFEALARRYGPALEPEIRLRADLAAAARFLSRGEVEAALELAREAGDRAAEAELPDYEARARGLLGEALERMGLTAEAKEAFREGHELLERAAARLDTPESRRSFLDRSVYRLVRRRGAARPRGDDRRLLALYEMIRALNSETDPDALLEAILDMALRAVAAERGMILLRRSASDPFSVRLVRNLEEETERDAERYSGRIVEQAEAGRSILALDAGQDERFRDLRSVSTYGIRSLMCVPLRSRGTIVGTVYLDSRREGTLFDQDDLRFIEAFADHAALALENARERAELESENRRLREVAEDRLRFGNLIGRSPAMQEVFRLIERVAASDLPVLIQGESGTGKELVARAVHFNGPRKRKVFLSENCAAIPETLLESELFGHVKGAFTGADRERAGLFEQAHGGALFLDEVGDMSAGMQARLLRALQEGEIRRVGADRSIRVDVRVIAATHRDLAAEAAAGRFREDLLYRLQVLAIQLPPLRERPEDIPLLIDHLLERIAGERGRPAPPMEREAREALERYEWPGNVRQLENTLQRLVLLAGEAPITRAELERDAAFRPLLARTGGAEGQVFSLDDGVREQLRQALKAAGGNRERAARMLGISRATIYRKIKQLGL